MAVEVDLKGLERQIKNVLNWPMTDIATRALELNFDQIDKKQNADGTRFKNYSESYANKKNVGAGAVDLTSKASALSKSSKKKPYATMLKSYAVLKATRYSATIGFRGTWDKQKARFNVTGGKSPNKARPFVGINDKNRKKLIKYAYLKIIKGTY